MELPIVLKTAIDVKTTGIKQAQLLKASQNISEKYKNESGRSKHLVNTSLESLAYSIVRMPATYGAVFTALKHTLEFFEDEITSFLDIGAGTGAASWAVYSQMGSKLSYTCLEREDAMISIATEYMANEPSLKKAKWIKHDLLTAPLSYSADLVIASYVLNELDEESRFRVLNDLWSATQKLLIIVEPGTPIGFSQINLARSIILGNGGSVIAPCPHNQKCMIGMDDWCHFTCRIARSKLHKFLKGGDAPYEDEKFSFIAFSKAPVRQATSRILRHPIKESGCITLKLCTVNGIITKKITKKQGELFKIARKADCGDSFKIS